MVITTKNIPIEKILFSYSRSFPLSENEKIDVFLDQINDQKNRLYSFSKKLKKLADLLREITWLENISEQDEIIIYGLLTMGKKADKLFKQTYADYRKEYLPKKLFKEELKMLCAAIKFHYETIKEVEHIIFVLRKDKDFNSLCNLLDAI